MRPVNLIPPEQRRGASAPTRTGSLSYIVIGALAVILVGVTVMVLSAKSVSDKESEVSRLEAEAAETTARAESLSTYTSFQQIHDARVATVSQLATSRFDWQRVLEELSKVIPQHVWLTNLTGTVAPGIQVGDGDANSNFRDAIPGPALEMVGCGRSQDDVARLVAAMRDIDGVTRVTAENSAKANSNTAAGGDSCQTKPNIPQFHLIAAFDGVVVEGTAIAPPADTTTTSDTTTTGTSGNDGGVGEVTTQSQQTKAEVNKADAKVDQATDLLPSGGG